MKCFERALSAGFSVPILSTGREHAAAETLKLDGSLVAENIREQCIRLVKGRVLPKLVVVIVGNDPASQVYVRNKEASFAKVGFASEVIRFSEFSNQSEVEVAISALAVDPSVHGILVQMPLPKGFNAPKILSFVPPSKDVDGYHAVNLGLLCAQDWTGFLPCTPLGVMVLLQAYGVAFLGAHACVVGRSNTVGKPQGLLLLGEDCTVTLAHSKSTDLASITQQADILVAAAGKPGLIGREHVKKGAVVVDVGIHQNPNGKGLVGDVRSAALEGWAKAVSPVPGGVGPMTIAMLLMNTALGAWDPS